MIFVTGHFLFLTNIAQPAIVTMNLRSTLLCSFLKHKDARPGMFLHRAAASIIWGKNARSVSAFFDFHRI